MGEVEEMVCVGVAEGAWHSGDGCDLASTLCKYYLKNRCDLVVLSWAMVRQVSLQNC